MQITFNLIDITRIFNLLPKLVLSHLRELVVSHLKVLKFSRFKVFQTDHALQNKGKLSVTPRQMIYGTEYMYINYTVSKNKSLSGTSMCEIGLKNVKNTPITVYKR